MKKRFADEQIIGFLKQAEGGIAIKDLCRKHGFSDAAFYEVGALPAGAFDQMIEQVKSIDMDAVRAEIAAGER